MSITRPQESWVLDAHVHFYDRRRLTPHAWPRPGDPLRASGGMPPDYQHDMRAWSMAGVIAVEASRSINDQWWLLNLAEETDWILGVVVYLNPKSPSFPADFASIAHCPSLRGVRLFGSSFRLMHRRLTAEILPALRDRGLTLDILAEPAELDAVRSAVAPFDQLNVVINHLGQPWRAAPNDRDHWRRGMDGLMSMPHVRCKLSGLEHEPRGLTGLDSAWQSEALRYVCDGFGPNRLLFGSNWPACRRAGALGRIRQKIEACLAHFSPQEQRRVWSWNALECYRLDVDCGSKGAATSFPDETAVASTP